MFSDSQSLLCAHTERTRCYLEKIDSVDALGSCLGRSLFFHLCHIGHVDFTHPLLDGLDDCLVVDLATMPFQLELFRFMLGCQLDLPEGLRDELFDFLGLVYAETKGWGLARTIRDRNFLS